MTVSAVSHRPPAARASSPFAAVMPRNVDGTPIQSLDSYDPSERASAPIAPESGYTSAVGAAAGATPGFPLELVLMGPPGSGKSTQAGILARKYHIPEINVGALLRTEASKSSPLGKKLRPYLERGDLAPVGLVYRVLSQRMARPDTEAGFILDGFPREKNQLPELKKLVQGHDLSHLQVIGLQVSDKTVEQRLSARGRKDDVPAVIQHRLSVFRKDTAPVVDHFVDQGNYFVVNGNGSVAQVTQRIEDCTMEWNLTPR